MIPEPVAEVLTQLPSEEIAKRLVAEGSKRYIEVDSDSIELRLRLGIETDRLGPEKVIILWDEDADLPVGGYLVIDNLAMGRPSLGGIRLANNVTPAMISSLARGMTMKNAAADIPFGGGKAGLVADQTMSPESKRQTVALFARLLKRYKMDFNPGPDVGMNDEDMGIIAMENGFDNVVSKPARMGGNQIDKCGATAGGVVVALEAILAQIDVLSQLPQFSALPSIISRPITVLIQGFGAVGAHTALLLDSADGRFRYKVLGISDANGFLFCENGINVSQFFQMAEDDKTVSSKFYLQTHSIGSPAMISMKFSNCRDDLLRESADVLIPAAPVANYIGLDRTANPSMTFDRVGHWHIIVEGANTYSAIQERKQERRSIERMLYRERGTFIAPDFLVNSGGVIFAAHEKLVPTPANLQLPVEIRSSYAECEEWLANRVHEFALLADERRVLAQAKRDEVIKQNMSLLIQELINDKMALPCDIAEHIAKSRIEEQRKVKSLLTHRFAVVSPNEGIRSVAKKMGDALSEVALVLASDQTLVGILTDWDIVAAVASCLDASSVAQEVMTKDVVTLRPEETIVNVKPMARMRGYSAIPVVDDSGRVLGIVQLQDLIEL